MVNRLRRGSKFTHESTLTVESKEQCFENMETGNFEISENFRGGYIIFRIKIVKLFRRIFKTLTRNVFPIRMIKLRKTQKVLVILVSILHRALGHQIPDRNHVVVIHLILLK